MTDAEKFRSLEVWAQARYVHFAIRFKEEVWWMRWLGVLLFFLNFKRTVTTLGYTIWFPGRRHLDSHLILAHELVHIENYHRSPRLFHWKYAFPQCLALLALVALGGIWYWPLLLALAFLGCAAPWPSPTRLNEEARAYGLELTLINPELRNYACQHYGSSLNGPTYWWASWSRQKAMIRILECTEPAFLQREYPELCQQLTTLT